MKYDPNKINFDENGSQIITKHEYWRTFRLDWTTIGSFDDYKAAMMANEEKPFVDCGIDEFKEFLSANPAFKKHYKIWF